MQVKFQNTPRLIDVCVGMRLTHPTRGTHDVAILVPTRFYDDDGEWWGYDGTFAPRASLDLARPWVGRVQWWNNRDLIVLAVIQRKGTEYVVFEKPSGDILTIALSAFVSNGEWADQLDRQPEQPAPVIDWKHETHAACRLLAQAQEVLEQVKKERDALVNALRATQGSIADFLCDFEDNTKQEVKR